MQKTQEYIAVLRCQTWNVWPEKNVVEHKEFEVEYGKEEKLKARLAILSYDKRTAPERYINEETNYGPLLWDGKIEGLYIVRENILKSPEDIIEVKTKHRNANRGEVDIAINFKFPGDIPPDLIETLRSTTFAILSLLNLQLGDCLTPSVPFQLSKVILKDSRQFESNMVVEVKQRQTVLSERLQTVISGITNSLLNSVYGQKLRIALELYAAHFTENQVRVRFLLLVIAMESLAKSTTKHQIAIDLLNSWKNELEDKMQKFEVSSDEYKNLDALSRELGFRSEDSIRSQIRKLFANLPGVDFEESDILQKRALRVYDKRSKLVHDGYLPTEDLCSLEVEARELLEKVFFCDIASATMIGTETE
jgi:hypothetical protein